jgi:glutamate-ammonia-ligase adenylyltransferase
LIDTILGSAPHPDAHAFGDMRARMERERGGKTQNGVHLKFGPGGMTDIEFLVQFHQLRRWGDDPAIRLPRTARVLERLVDSGVLSREEGHALVVAHGFLKGVENRLGLVLDHKGTDQPCSRDELGALGVPEDAEWAPAPRPGEGFPELLTRVMAGVREIYLKRLTESGAAAP